MGQNAAKIIGKPYQLKNIEVARNDFPNTQNWNDAIAKCNKLGEGWRLPTKEELNKLFKNKKKIGGFKDSFLDDFYWSSAEKENLVAPGQDFFNGNQSTANKHLKNYVRAVRTK